MNPRAILGWTAGYTALTLLLTYPLVLHLSATVPHDLGDPLLSTSLLWWNAHVLPLTERWWNGLAFYPASGFLAYSDHRLGESLIATPLQWLGCGPATAYNLTLIATYPLCAIAAHWLAFTLTRRHDASALCGLAYGFSPYRVAHLEHLELLAAFGMPAALAALHCYTETRRRPWLAVFSLALVVQGLCTSYYLLFFAVLLGLWIVWFLRPRDLPAIAEIGVASAAAGVALLPIAIGYARIHRRFGFVRPFHEILALSGDVTSIFTASPFSLLWGWLARPDAPEGALFPGLTIAVVAFAGGAVAIGAHRLARDRLDRVSVRLLILAAVPAAIAGYGWAFAPWRLALPFVRLSSDAPFKPMTLAVVAAAAAVALSSPARAAYARRSPLAFYLLATLMMYLCSFGPKPSLLHHQILYEAPYAWLMPIPVFSSIRAPARFAMLAVLTLAVSGALAFARLRLVGGRRVAIAAALMLAVTADGWMRNLALPALPDVWAAPRTDGFTAVVELPLGDVYGDVAAMYRATSHGRPVVNGNSGFDPMHYYTLKTALEEHDPAVFDALTIAGPVLVAIDKRTDADGAWQSYAASLPRLTRLADEGDRVFFAAGVSPPPAPTCQGDRLPLAGVSDDQRRLGVDQFSDGDILTRWTTGHSQRIGDALTVDLGHVAAPCAIALALGEFRRNYARRLLLDTSPDGADWTAPTSIRTAPLTIRAAVEDPRLVSIAIAVTPAPSRFIRLRIAEPAPDAWVVSEITVSGVRRPG